MNTLKEVEHNEQEIEGIEYKGVFYPYDFKELKRRADALMVPVDSRIEYLQGAMMAYSIERRDMTELMCYIGELQDEYDRIVTMMARTEELNSRCTIRTDTYGYGESGGSYMARFGFPMNLRRDAERVPMGLNIAMMGRIGEAFRVADDIEEGDVRSLQNSLVSSRLLSVGEGCPYKDPLLVCFGTKNNAGKTPYKLQWLGRNNQLRCLIDTLYCNKVISCAKDRKWAITSQLFVKGHERVPYTSKQISNAKDINIDDEREVVKCIPKLWISGKLRNI
ncbi:MAG: hypothetical protein IJR13_01355 [Bacteroidales bacterium]|nr:hypothetical protein [Bacteroidales bacterium]